MCILYKGYTFDILATEEEDGTYVYIPVFKDGKLILEKQKTEIFEEGIKDDRE